MPKNKPNKINGKDIKPCKKDILNRKRGAKPLIRAKAETGSFPYIAMTDEENPQVIHYGFVEVGQEVVTGQEKLETFDNITDYEARLTELGIVVDTEE